jgi:hypothetical protein
MAYKISKILDTKPDELFYEAFKKWIKNSFFLFVKWYLFWLYW